MYVHVYMLLCIDGIHDFTPSWMIWEAFPILLVYILSNMCTNIVCIIDVHSYPNAHTIVMSFAY